MQIPPTKLARIWSTCEKCAKTFKTKTLFTKHIQIPPTKQTNKLELDLNVKNALKYLYSGSTRTVSLATATTASTRLISTACARTATIASVTRRASSRYASRIIWIMMSKLTSLCPAHGPSRASGHPVWGWVPGLPWGPLPERRLRVKRPS